MLLICLMNMLNTLRAARRKFLTYLWLCLLHIRLPGRMHHLERTTIASDLRCMRISTSASVRGPMAVKNMSREGVHQ